MSSNTASTQDFHVAIIGGGIAGVALGLGLARRNVPFQIYERLPVFEEYSAGLGIRSNGIAALKMIDPRLVDVFEQIVVRPPGDENEFELLDAHEMGDGPGVKLPWDRDGGMVHRSQLLQAMAKLLPPDATTFGKQLKMIEENTSDVSGPLRLVFEDGSDALASAVIGCDGLGSRVRRAVVGSDHPSARAGYTHRYCYRCLIPMDEAVKALGSREKATKQRGWVTKDAYVVQFTVSNNRAVSFNAIFDRPDNWPDEHRTIVRATKEQVKRDFQGWNSEVNSLVECLKPEVDQWALFDQYDHPLPAYSRGRVCVTGDAAHATTPHLGVGASVAMCDAAVMSELLQYVHERNHASAAAALAAYSEVRLAQGHRLVQLSREMGSTTMCRDPVIGNDRTKIKDRILEWTAKVKEDDLLYGIERAKAMIDEQSSHTS